MINKIDLFTILISFTLAMGCTNITSHTSTANTANGTITAATSTNTVYSHTVKNFSYAATAAVGGVAELMLTITTDTSSSNYQPLTGFCGIGTSTTAAAVNPCACELVWTQESTAGTTNYSYSRTKRVNVTAVQSGLVNCLLEQSVWNEIPTGTVLAIRIVPLSATSNLNTSVFDYKTGTVSAGSLADFSDDTLTPFLNISRYTCFSKSANRAYQMTNQYGVATATGTPTAGGSAANVNIFLGSRYCTSSGAASTSGAGGANTQCLPPRNGFSAQSYYRNFYKRSDKTFTNSSNDTYDCPIAIESLKYSAGPGIPASESLNYYPLDTTFALASTNSSEWSVGVPAATTLAKAGDQNSQDVYCSGEDKTKRLTDTKTVNQCLGYAKPPAANGTCGTIKDSNGRIRPLTRLRRFRVIYPPVFSSNGAVVAGNPFADEIYVADRLAVDSSGTATGNMIYGPKPCNYAWFDHEGVTMRDGAINFASDLRPDGTNMYATPRYAATSDYQYIEFRSTPGLSTLKYSVDPDGIVLPNDDRTGTINNASMYGSCSATLPWVDFLNGAPNDLRLITTNRYRTDTIALGSHTIPLREIHNQTVDPWTPNYVEDTSFLACVPLPSTIIEPPLHFYKKDNNTMGWCAEVYPTQNPYWYDLNKYRKPQVNSAVVTDNLVNFSGTNTAPVKNYTSHDLNGGISTLLDAEFNGNCRGTDGNTICPMTSAQAPIASCVTYLNNGRKDPVTGVQALTCDRTFKVEVGAASLTNNLDFPLLAADADINKMLADDLNHDQSFSCEYSVNADPTKVGKRMPASGCCGYVGAPTHPLLNSVLSGPNGSSGHLEPYKDPAATTDVRFCGWPVE